MISIGACVHSTGTPMSMVSTSSSEMNLATVPPPPRVNLAQFANLPYNVCFIQDCTYFAGEFCVAVVGAAFTAGTGVFYNTYAVVQEGGVLFFISVCKCRVECCTYVSGQALGVAQNASYRNAVWLCQSAGKYSRNLECIPVLPSEPTSSLSAKITTEVHSGFLLSISAIISV